MSDSNNSNSPVDLTGPDEPAKKVPKLLTGFFRKYDPSDPAQVAAKVDRDTKRLGHHRTCMDRSRLIVWQFVATATKSPDTVHPLLARSSL